MRKYIALIFGLVAFTNTAFSQRMSISGNVQDTVSKNPLVYAVAMAVRIKDSTIIAHTRTNSKGGFILQNLPIDTVEVIISHPKFGDQSFYVFGSTVNNVFDFGKIILPPKSQQLKEVVIYAFKDPVYYKGDTLVYTADSFKVKPNATVEDLLKKLPGIRVDAQGKISSQGESVDQVLVDGDEFFGTDPTMATKNLNANSLESVQVYDKKNENQSETNDKETIKVMNLKLKEDSKKGYFGKLSGASDFQKFYEGELLLNRFSSRQKISVFGLGSNTPRADFGWSDLNKYGLDNNNNNYNYSDEEGFSWEGGSQTKGIPQTLKTGIYYTDKISKKTKLTFNYTYGNTELRENTETRSQYFLSDTSYITNDFSRSFQKNESHSVNFSLSQNLDSLTELEIQPKLKLVTTSKSTLIINDFLTDTDTLTRQTVTTNNNKSEAYDINTNFKLKRNFKKKDRQLNLNYRYTQNDNISEGVLKSSNDFYVNFPFTIDTTDIDQQKNNNNNNQTHNGGMSFTEPLSKKIKMEFSYDYVFNVGIQDKKALNYINGEYSSYDSTLTNNFENKKSTQRAGLKFIYEVKKHRFVVGARFRQVDVINTNMINRQKITQNVNNILPHLNYMYKFSDNQRLRFQYTTNSNLPGIEQLQPVPDNNNPNKIKLGNPNLLPTFNQNFSLSFNSYKPISGKYIWANISFSTINNAFTNAITYDSIGRTITQPINVNGNFNSNSYIGAGLPLFSKILQLNPNLNFNYNSYASVINNQKNTTKTSNTSAGLEINLNLDTLEFTISGNYNYNYPISSVNAQSNKPYSAQTYNAGFRLRLPFKFLFETETTYTMNDQRSEGYNINYVIWNAALRKTFFKNENLIVSFEATDILNQNISTNRIVQDNVITDTKTNIISQFYLLRAVFKFNSSKTKETDEYY
ncbi:MAG: TonB-dependent receptor domain-containing protein [Bacteroidota bacterium]